jgi:hypothetical protein
MDKYSVWIDSAMVYMKKGIDKGGITKIIDGKTNSAFAEMATPKSKIIYFTLPLN